MGVMSVILGFGGYEADVVLKLGLIVIRCLGKGFRIWEFFFFLRNGPVPLLELGTGAGF